MKNKNKVLIILLFFIVLAIVVLENQKVVNNVDTTVSGNAPELVGISAYHNTEDQEITIADLRGKVVLIDFWTYTCINCIRTLPHLVRWDETYRDEGLVIIGVHTPEFGFEKEYENVKNAIEKYDIEYAVVQDNDYATWRAFNNRYWPHKYLIDSEGNIRYDHIGEGNYEETEEKIVELLNEIDGVDESVGVALPDLTPRFQKTPELYAGYGFALSRGQDIANGGLNPNQITDYQLPTVIDPHVIYLSGKWMSNTDDLTAKEDGASIVLKFIAKNVNIVADTIEESVMEVRINGESVLVSQAGEDTVVQDTISFVIINEPRLYDVIDGTYGIYTIELIVKEGFNFNAFTFG